MDKEVVTSKKPKSVIGLEDRRKFKLENGDDLYIRRPSAEAIRQSDWVYSKIYNEAFLGGVMTAAQMMDELKKRKIVSDEYDKDINDARERLTRGIIELTNTTDSDEKEKAAINVAVTREELSILNHKINGPLSNTCEQLAEDAKIDYLTASIVETLDGSRIWDSYDVYCVEPDTDKAFRTRMEVMLFLRNVESDFLENVPEQIALREIRVERTKKLSDLIEKKLQADEAFAATEAAKNSEVPEVPQEDVKQDDGSVAVEDIDAELPAEIKQVSEVVPEEVKSKPKSKKTKKITKDSE
jgi:hypothetical protein